MSRSPGKLTDAFDHRYSVAPRNGIRSPGHIIEGGMDTARSKTPSTPQEAAARQAEQRDALAYLARRGLADGPDSVAAILGLTAVPPRRRSQGAVLESKAYPIKRCPECEQDFTPRKPEQATCSLRCGRAHQTKTLRAARGRVQDLDAGGVS